MKVTNQPDGLFTLEADQGKTLVNETNGIHCRRAIDQTEAQLQDWTEDETTTTTPTTPSQEEDDERGGVNFVK